MLATSCKPKLPETDAFSVPLTEKLGGDILVIAVKRNELEKNRYKLVDLPGHCVEFDIRVVEQASDLRMQDNDAMQ